MRHLTDKKRAGALLATTMAVLISGTVLFGPIGRGPATVQAVQEAGRVEDITVSSRGDRRADFLTTSAPTPVPSTPVAPAATATPAPTPTPVPLSAYELKKPASQVRVGIQAGHWKPSEAPEEIAYFRNSTGASQDGWSEASINLDLSRRVAQLLKAQGIQVDLIPVTVPKSYKADAFLSIHGDANTDPKLSGFKAARSAWSKIPTQDDALLGVINREYGQGTGLKEHRATITDNMTMYFGFNRKYAHSVDPSTPAVILETGFLTNDGDRKLIQSQPDRIAESIARGLLSFLSNK